MSGKNNIGLVLIVSLIAGLVSGGVAGYGVSTMDLSGAGLSADAEGGNADIDAAVRDGIEKYVEEQQEKADEQRAEAEQRQNQDKDELAKNVKPVSSETDFIYGDESATVSLVEFSDFQCPFCKRFHPTAKQVVDDSEGKVNWVYRHFPLSIHEPAASMQANAIECVGEEMGAEKFWEFADVLYDENPKDQESLVAAAVALGADEATFSSCLENETYGDRIDEDSADGANSGVTGTPGTIAINNETGEAKFISGAQPVAAVQAAVDELLGE